jgi:hypothetical protein
MEKVVKKSELRIETLNTVGIMAEIASRMAENGVDIINLSACSHGERAFINLITNDNARARRALEGKGYKIEEHEVVVLVLWNRPGALSVVAGKIRDSQVNLKSVYGTSSPDGVRATIVFSSEDDTKVSEIFDEIVLAEEDAKIMP